MPPLGKITANQGEACDMVEAATKISVQDVVSDAEWQQRVDLAACLLYRRRKPASTRRASSTTSAV